MSRTLQKSLLSILLSRLGKKPRPQEPATPPRPFQAISIYRGTVACVVARKFNEHRFLARDAPTLPFTGCTMRETCQCRYLKHKDRRAEARRLIDFGMSPRIFDGAERRLRGGRRTADPRRSR